MNMRSIPMMFASLIICFAATATTAGCTPTTTERYACPAPPECPGFPTTMRTASGFPATAWANRRYKVRRQLREAPLLEAKWTGTLSKPGYRRAKSRHCRAWRPS
jgi:hypothetical protein